MIEHNINVTRSQRGLDITLRTIRLMKACIVVGLEREGFPTPAHVEITLTDDDGIRAINYAQRNIDSATDVLSFPQLDWHDGQGDIDELDFDPETGRVPLGDIVISTTRAHAQAREFGHSFARECCFLTVHSLMHLLGYDHVDDEERRALMREHEEAVLSLMGLTRED